MFSASTDYETITAKPASGEVLFSHYDCSYMFLNAFFALRGHLFATVVQAWKQAVVSEHRRVCFFLTPVVSRGTITLVEQNISFSSGPKICTR